ncbi:MAG: flippase-like domain-containing protein [Methanomicrobiales archaeon]|nr:flippase-like domain-containing protein [Methanomicrobiales archaeon]
MKNDLLKFIQFLFAILIIIYLIFSFNFQLLLSELSSIDLRFLILGGFAYLLNNMLMAYRLKVILKKLGSYIRFKFVFLSHMGGMIASDVTPARSGYIYTAYALKGHGIDYSKGLASITSTFIFDLTFKLGIAVIGIAYIFSAIFYIESIYFLILSFLLVTFIIGVYLVITYKDEFSERLFKKFKLKREILDMLSLNKKIHTMLPFIFSISFFGWILRGVEWFLIAAAIQGCTLSLTESLFLNPLITLFSIIPLTPAGLGVQEAGAIGIISLFGIVPSIALLFALTVRIIEMAIDSIGLYTFFYKGLGDADRIQYYNSINGDIDEKAYYSDLHVQRFFQQRRTDKIIKAFNLKIGNILLDIGCGSGVQIATSHPENFNAIIGIDINENALKFARSKNIPNADFLIADAQQIPLKNACVDHIISAEIIEHLPKPETFIDEITRILQDKGEVVISTPNEISIWGFYEVLWDIFGRGRNYGKTHFHFFSRYDFYKYFSHYTEYHAITLFILSPLIALSSNKWAIKYGLKIDSIFERWGWGVIIIFHAIK